MKHSKKMIALVLVLMMALSTVAVSDVKVSRAADYSSASNLSFSGTWSSDKYFTESNREHWYRLSITSDGDWNMRIMSYMDARVYWELYNSDLSKELWSDRVSDGSETSPETESHDVVLSKGTYYIKIYTYNAGKYKLYSDFKFYGVNDAAAISYDSPLKYKLGSNITGAITETDHEDWYKIVVPSTGYYTQKIVAYSSRINWELYNWDLSKEINSGRVSYGSDSAPKTIKDDIVLSKGTYYVKITGNTGKYVYRFVKLSKSSCSHDYDSTWHDATYFKRGYRQYRCKKCGYSYKADYESKLKLGQGYFYSYSSAGKGKLFLSWSTIWGASGYQIRYSRNKKFKSGTVIKQVKGQSKSSKTIGKLSRKKKYYVQIRAYKKSGSKTAYGSWSSRICLKTK